MTELVACACGLDPATETMAAQIGIALVLSAPWWFRDQIREGLRRLRGQTTKECDGSTDEVEPD
jgi:hypothetical protein